jgi:hypothetical protein
MERILCQVNALPKLDVHLLSLAVLVLIKLLCGFNISIPSNQFYL